MQAQLEVNGAVREAARTLPVAHDADALMAGRGISQTHVADGWTRLQAACGPWGRRPGPPPRWRCGLE